MTSNRKGGDENVYLVNVEIKANMSSYSADMSFTDGSGRLHEKHIHEMRRYTMQSNYLAALITALEVLQKPCKLSIYSGSDYIVEPIRQGWLQNWARNDWHNAKGKEVRNAEQWQQVKKLLAGHSVKFIKKEAAEWEG